MLVLVRRRGESIMIGDDVQVTVVDIRGDKVRLGITAPSQVEVHRQEVYEAIQRGESQNGLRRSVSGGTPQQNDKQEVSGEDRPPDTPGVL